MYASQVVSAFLLAAARLRRLPCRIAAFSNTHDGCRDTHKPDD